MRYRHRQVGCFRGFGQVTGRMSTVFSDPRAPALAPAPAPAPLITDPAARPVRDPSALLRLQIAAQRAEPTVAPIAPAPLPDVRVAPSVEAAMRPTTVLQMQPQIETALIPGATKPAPMVAAALDPMQMPAAPPPPPPPTAPYPGGPAVTMAHTAAAAAGLPGIAPQMYPGIFPQAALPQAYPTAFPYSYPPPPPIPGVGCPPGTIAGKDPGTCFSIEGGHMVMQQFPMDDLTAGHIAMNSQQVPRVSVNVNVPSKQAEQQSDKDVDELDLPPPTKKAPLGLMAAGLAALYLLVR